MRRRLVTHTSKLMEEKQEGLCIKILQTLREMMAVDPEFGEKVSLCANHCSQFLDLSFLQGDALRMSLLIRYFAKVPLQPMQVVPTQSLPVSHGPGSKFLMRAQMSLHDVQCHLDNQGASKLIVDLVIKSANMPKIFSEVKGRLLCTYQVKLCSSSIS